MKFLKHCLVAGLLFALTSCADSPTGPSLQLLGSGSFFTAAHGRNGTLVTEFTAGTFGGPNAALFDTIRVDSNSVGRDFAATAATDTDFAAVAGLLANGTANSVCTAGCEFSCVFQCSDEKSFFGLGTTDFAPHHVEQVDLRVDSTAVRDDPLGGVDRFYFFTVTVFGSR